jgi:hypothetical protein
VRLDYAAIYAKNSSVKVDVILIGEMEKSDEEVISNTLRLAGGDLLLARERKELVLALKKVFS